jgi:hypothetical protein
MRKLPLAVSALLLSAIGVQAGAGQRYTTTQGPACRDVSRKHMTLRVCPGAGGYEVTLADEGNVAAVTFTRAGYDRTNGPTAAWRAAGDVFGKLIEWRIGRDGQPYAAILRAWESNDRDEPIAFLRVFALNHTLACEYGKVMGGRSNANAEAAWLSDQAARHDCSKPPPETFAVTREVLMPKHGHQEKSAP